MLSPLVRAPLPGQSERSPWPLLLAGLAVALLVVLLLLPGSIASKTHLALHGVCAQRPSHSLQLGGTALPLDARMSGIYIGAATTALWLLAIGKAWNVRVPSRRVVGVLALFVLLMAADGFNALADDLGLPHPYEPVNTLRLLTGALAGTAMGVALVHLLAVTVWERANRHAPVVSGFAPLIVPLSIALALGTLALSGLPSLYAPFAVGLLLAAVGVFAWLATIALTLLTHRGWTYRSIRELAAMACGGLAMAVGLIAALAAVRLVMETWFGLPSLT